MAKILIVDDSGLSRRAIRKILASAGHEVIEASEGAEALEQYSLNRPDLVFLDLLMTGMDGLKVLSTLLEMDPRARVIIATADIQSSTRELAMAGGAQSFINKPLTGDKVLGALHMALHGDDDAIDGTPD
jgi:two-component system chemotaxis response regulator CheY